VWWNVEHPAAAADVVRDAVERLRVYGEPYLRDVAQQLGVVFGPVGPERGGPGRQGEHGKMDFDRGER
jgi:hypothetical protein